MLMKRAHWAFYWPKYTCTNLADIWTVNNPDAWHMFRLIKFCISNRL